MMRKDNRNPINRSLLAMAAVQLMPLAAFAQQAGERPKPPLSHSPHVATAHV